MTSRGKIHEQPDADGQHQTTYHRIVTEAAGLFFERGYAATSVRDIAQALGMRSASLYHHITSKEELLHAMSLESLDHIELAVERELADEPESKRASRLRSLIIAHTSAAVSKREMHAVMLMELRCLTDEHQIEIISRRERYEALVQREIEGARAAGSLRSDIPSKYVTLALFNLLNWSIFWFRPGGGLTGRQLGELLATIFLEGSLAWRPAGSG